MTASSLQPLIDAVTALSLPADARVLVAVSGGPDSVALALALHGWASSGGRTAALRLGHVNHGLRGSAADADEQLVHSLAQRLDLPLEVERVDTLREARKRHQSLETAARNLRYAALRDMLHRWGGDAIALGHHADDQAETVLMHLLRGSGLDGAAGMSPRSGDLVRPFLQLTRRAIVETLDAAGEPYRYDASNDDESHRRNFLRRRVFPLLEQLSPKPGLQLARAAALLDADRVYLEREAMGAFNYLDVESGAEEIAASLGAWRALHPALQAHLLRQMIVAVRGDALDVSRMHVESLRAFLLTDQPAVAAPDRLPGMLNAKREGDRFRLTSRLKGVETQWEPVRLAIPGECQVPGGHLTASHIPTGEESALAYRLAVCGPLHALCDGEAIGDSLLVRPRRPGDRIRLRGGTRKLQDLLVDAHVPRHRRDFMPVIENGDFVVWVPGLALDCRAAAGPSTNRVTHLRFRTFSLTGG